MSWLNRLYPARTIPVTRWRSEGSRWRSGPGTFVVLIVGLWLFGTGEALLVGAGLGVSPWTVLAQGIGVRFGISLGWATFATSAVVLLLWIPLRERPGLGTLMNAVVIAVSLDVMARVLPPVTSFGVAVALTLLGVAVVGFGSGLYLTTNLGPGPRDGWMTGLHYRFGYPVAAIRLAIECLALAVGWALGGTVGLGTLLWAALIGPAVGYGLGLAGRLGRL